jgi:hypothetical protein
VLNGRECVKPARVLAQKDLSTGGIGGHEDPELRSLCFTSLPTFALEITGDEAGNTPRKSVFAAADGIQDLESRPAVSQRCVEIAAASPDGHTECLMSALDRMSLRTMHNTTSGCVTNKTS